MHTKSFMIFLNSLSFGFRWPWQGGVANRRIATSRRFRSYWEKHKFQLFRTT